ncbi:MAG: EAL domain-containing protein [Mycobacterium sp.]|nr:EAL domain-containing protein [Mycobacterium sp.]
MRQPTADDAEGSAVAGDSALMDLREQCRLGFEFAPINLALVGLDGSLLVGNSAFHRLFGGSSGIFTDTNFLDVGPGHDAGIGSLVNVLSGRTASATFEKRYVRADGGIFKAKVHVSLAKGHDGTPLCFVAQIEGRRDPKPQSEMSEDPDDSRYAALVNHTSDVVAITGRDGAVTYINPACMTLYGLRPHEMIGTHLTDLVHPDDRQSIIQRRRRLMAGHLAAVTYECRVRHAQLGWRHMEATVTNHLADPEIRGWVSTARDVTDRVEAGEYLPHSVRHDELTGLPNRLRLLDRLERAMQAAGRGRTELAVLIVDLDRFQGVNDSFGRATGDRVLIEMAERISAVVQPVGSVARSGGDEFTVLAQNLNRRDEATEIAERIRAAVAARLEIDGQSLSIGCSIGITFPDSGDRPESVLHEADLATQRGKELGRNRTLIYHRDMRNRTRLRLEAERTIRWALEHDGVRVQYQPIITMDTGLLWGTEALVRVCGQDGDLASPRQLIPAAEDNGLIVPLGEAVLDTACAQLARWVESGLPTEVMTVNVSPRQLESPQFVGRLASTIATHGLAPRRLCLEITESKLIDSGSSALHIIAAIKDLGVMLALDDFGTGWASLALLRRFPFDAIKIDARFVSGLGTNKGDEEVVKAVIGLGEALGMTVVAEGVETTTQETKLREFGCPYAQGFRYAKPVPSEQITTLAHLLHR